MFYKILHFLIKLNFSKEMKKLADDIEEDLNAVSDQLEEAWLLEDSARRKV